MSAKCRCRGTRVAIRLDRVEDLSQQPAGPEPRHLPRSFELVIEMARNMSVVLYVVALIAVVVSVDFMFFKDRFWERLMVNIGIVLVFGAFYLRFLKNP
jgi:hypothetical protein